MADAYSQQDADPVKSSGIQAKKVSYKWRTVTPEDMTNFNKAWFEIVKDNPIIALDALLAKCFGYFNVNDQPYVSMDYYVTSDYVQKNSTWIKDYNHDWREHIAGLHSRMGRYSRTRLAYARQFLRGDDIADRRGRGDSPTLAHPHDPYSAATADGRDDHRAGQ